MHARSRTTSSGTSTSSGVTTACEYLADQGLIGKASTPVRLTKRSNVDVQELAFFYRGAAPPTAALDMAKPGSERRRAARARRSPCRARASTTSRTSRVEIPRDSLIVVTGLSGSGKSSLAFDTIYAEGQRRYMESLSSYRQAVRRAGGQARRGLRVRPVAGHLDRAEDARQQPALDRRHDDRHRQLPEPAVRDDRPAALPAHRRADAEPDGEPDPRGDPVAARGHGGRAARAGVQGLRRGARLRLHRGAEEGLPAADRRRQAGGHLDARSSIDDVEGPAHGRGRRPVRGQPQAREGDQGRRSPPRCWSATG